MYLFTVIACDPVSASKAGIQLSHKKISVVFCGNTEKEINTAKAVASHCGEAVDIEIIDDLRYTGELSDRDGVKRFMDMLYEKFPGSREGAAAVVSSEFFGKVFGPVIIKAPDELIDKGIAEMSAPEGAISFFEVYEGKGTALTVVNHTYHLGVPDDAIPDEFAL